MVAGFQEQANSFFFFFFLIFKLYKIVLVLPNIKMNPANSFLRPGPGKLHSVTSVVSHILDSRGKDIQSHLWMGGVFRNFGYT